ncbi:MAG: hypothetical protein M1825_004566 [Sarcosagium campestre]|nr:MAG: hypothetical protein M1825_004566 [Sarcosagium campestre]
MSQRLPHSRPIRRSSSSSSSSSSSGASSGPAQTSSTNSKSSLPVPPESPSPNDQRNTLHGQRQRQRQKQRRSAPDTRSEDSPPIFTLIDILRSIAGLLLLSALLSYFVTNNSFTWNRRPRWTQPRFILSYIRGPQLLTLDQLSLHNGTDPSLPIYVALSGIIYDVSDFLNGGYSSRMYGPGASYNVLAGRDGARAFATGCFSAEDVVSDLRGAELAFLPVGWEDSLQLEEGESPREGKLRREREAREARAKVRERVRGWEEFLKGKYPVVGRVVAIDNRAGDQGQSGRLKEESKEEKGEKKEAVRRICEAAQVKRPKRMGQAVEKGAGGPAEKGGT